MREAGWFIEFRVHTLDNTGDRFGHFLAVEDELGSLGVLLNRDSLEFYRGDFINYHSGIPEMDGPHAITPGFHTIRIEMLPGGTHFDISLDGSPLGSIAGDASNKGITRLSFGDGSSNSAARGVWDYLLVNQEASAPAGSVSEPALRIYVEEDTTIDAEVAHVPEAISYFAFDGYGVLSGKAQSGSVVGEIGRVDDLTDESYLVQLQHSYLNPVVIAQSPSYHGMDAVVVRVSDVQSDRFTLALQEPSNLNGYHGMSETVSYLVLESGQWMLADGTSVAAGLFSTAATVGRLTANPHWHTLSFQDDFTTAPVVVSQVMTDNNLAYVKTRQQNLTASAVEVALEGEEAASLSHGTETIGYLAIEPTSGFWSGIPFEAATTSQVIDNAGETVSFSQNYGVAPGLLASTSSYADNDHVALRYATLTDRGVKLFAEEDTTFDTETAHTAESVSYLAIGGTGLLSAFLPVDLPQVTTVLRNGGSSNHDVLAALSVSFNQDVNVTADSLVLVNETGHGALVDLTGIGFDYDVMNRTATWYFSGIAEVISAAWYTANLDATKITGVAGIALDGNGDGLAGDDYLHTLLVARRGDANLDAQVDVADFNTLVSHFDPLGLQRDNDWSGGDFDGDEDIDIRDFVLLVKNFSPLGYTSDVPVISVVYKSIATRDTAATRNGSDGVPVDGPAVSLDTRKVELVRRKAFSEWKQLNKHDLLLDDRSLIRRTRLSQYTEMYTK